MKYEVEGIIIEDLGEFVLIDGCCLRKSKIDAYFIDSSGILKVFCNGEYFTQSDISNTKEVINKLKDIISGDKL